MLDAHLGAEGGESGVGGGARTGQDMTSRKTQMTLNVRACGVGLITCKWYSVPRTRPGN